MRKCLDREQRLRVRRGKPREVVKERRHVRETCLVERGSDRFPKSRFRSVGEVVGERPRMGRPKFARRLERGTKRPVTPRDVVDGRAHGFAHGFDERPPDDFPGVGRVLQTRGADRGGKRRRVRFGAERQKHPQNVERKRKRLSAQEERRREGLLHAFVRERQGVARKGEPNDGEAGGSGSHRK